MRFNFPLSNWNLCHSKRICSVSFMQHVSFYITIWRELFSHHASLFNTVYGGTDFGTDPEEPAWRTVKYR